MTGVFKHLTLSVRLYTCTYQTHRYIDRHCSSICLNNICNTYSQYKLAITMAIILRPTQHKPVHCQPPSHYVNVYMSTTSAVVHNCRQLIWQGYICADWQDVDLDMIQQRPHATGKSETRLLENHTYHYNSCYHPPTKQHSNNVGGICLSVCM